MKNFTSLGNFYHRSWSVVGFLVLLLATALPRNAMGQTIQSTNPNTTVGGQSITMIITGVNTNFTVVTGLYLRSNSQSTSYQPVNFNATSSTNMTANFTIPPNAPLGMYGLYGYGNFAPYLSALNVTLGPGSAFGQVSGKVMIDNNSNCVEDVGDSPVSGAIITLTPGPYYITTGTQGDYSAWIPNGTYTATTSNIGAGNWVCASSHPINIVTSLSTDVGNDFYWHHTPYSDQYVDINLPFFRPGFSQSTSVWFINSGNTGITNAIGTIDIDPALPITSITPTPTQITGNTYEWNFGTLGANSSRLVMINSTIPVNATLGQTLIFSASYPAVILDPNLINNNMARSRNISGSFDPNDKTVWDMNGILADGPTDPSTTHLDYTIRFQNTGTDTAFNIVVKDTINSYLNPGSLRITGSSHPCQFSLSGTGNVQFTFANILLVDSIHNEPLSHGYVNFRIDLDPGVPVGTTISNRASIYFDFNPPVVTNRTNTLLCPLLSSNFSATNVGPNFNFTDLSGPSPTAWAWDFGDGSTSTLQNPTHTYAGGGMYVVCLTASNACRSVSYCDTVYTCQFPLPAFSSVFSNNIATFTNQSHPSVTAWAWDFGDGGTSTLANPNHTYTTNGTYTVCLTTTNSCATQTVCNTVTICRNLNTSISHNLSGNTVTFQDLSDVSATGWAWTFGDGGTSNLQNPSHTYTAPGNYNACLIVSSSCATDTICVVITICPTLNQNFSSAISGFTVNFTDLSDPSATSWAWDFGDGGTSIQQNPSHTYSTGAAYNVCLTVSNPCFTATTCTPVDLCQPTNESIGYTPGPGLSMAFTCNADPSVNVWSWTFGDGGTSTLQNPSHTYTSPGSYQACVHVQNACSSSTSCVNLLLVGIEDASRAVFQVYPNPSAGIFMIEGELPVQGDLRMRLFDAKGAAVGKIERFMPAGAFHEVIDLSGQAAGLYLLYLEHEGQTFAIRLQKQ